MNQKEFTENLIVELNTIQEYYNPTNLQFKLFEEHNIKDHRIHIGIKHDDYKNGEQIIIDQVYLYKEFNDGLFNTVYKILNNLIMRSLLFGNFFKQTIKTIQVLE